MLNTIIEQFHAMINKLAIILLLLNLSCIDKKSIKTGIYHYYDEKETNGLVSKTIRLKDNKTFCLMGIKLLTIDPKADTIAQFKTDDYKYITLIAYGDWFILGHYLILNANNEYLDHEAEHYLLEDTIYTQMRNARYQTAVPNIQSDSFLIKSNSNILEEVKTGHRLLFLKK